MKTLRQFSNSIMKGKKNLIIKPTQESKEREREK